MELKKLQPALTVEEQVENLKKINLIIEDEEYAQSFLNDVSYFRFIKAYSLGHKTKNGAYDANMSFEVLVDLYKFNCNFRHALFPIIERIEVNLRCRIANHFSKKYGVLGYEDPNNFLNEKYHNKFLEEIQEEIKRNSQSPFVKNFIENYEEARLPMYALIELFSFGTLSKFFKNMKGEDKKVIANAYGINYSLLEGWFECIAYVRNICAHYGRLYNAKLAKTPELPKQYKGQSISTLRIFGIILCMHHLVSYDIHWYYFVDQIDELIKRYPAVDIKTMGFPANWKELLNQGRPERPSEIHKIQ